MIADAIHGSSKALHVKCGDTHVFGMDFLQRRAFSPAECEERFAAVWAEKLQPQLQLAHAVSLDTARELLDPKLHSNVKPGYEYREFVVNNVHFLARLSSDGAVCDHLWTLSGHHDPTKLTVYFPSAEVKDRFGETARQLGWEAKALAAKLLCDFLDAVQGPPAPRDPPASGGEATD